MLLYTHQQNIHNLLKTKSIVQDFFVAAACLECWPIIFGVLPTAAVFDAHRLELPAFELPRGDVLLADCCCCLLVEEAAIVEILFAVWLLLPLLLALLALLWLLLPMMWPLPMLMGNVDNGAADDNVDAAGVGAKIVDVIGRWWTWR